MHTHQATSTDILMTRVMRSRSQTLLHVAGMLAGTLPIAFGVIRAATTGTDFRYLWVAIAALIGAAAVTARGQARGRIAVLLMALCASAVLAAATAFAGGARSRGAVLVVALAFGACEAVGSALVVRSRGA